MKDNPETDDQIIAQGLNFVRQGLLKGDWSPVERGYALITGEEIQVSAAPISRLANIRQLMGNGPGPAELPAAGPKLKSKPSKTPKSRPMTLEEEIERDKAAEEGKIDTNEIKIRQGKKGKFARGTLTVISTTIDPAEAQLNAMRKRADRMPRPKPQKPRSNPKAPVRAWDPDQIPSMPRD